MSRAGRALLGPLALFLVIQLVSCGRLGAPVPPEYVGVGPLLERERQKTPAEQPSKEAPRTFTAEEADQGSTPSVEEVILPPLQPVGTR